MKIKKTLLSLEGITGLSFSILIAFGVFRSLLTGQSMPLAWPLVVGIICTLLLFSNPAKFDPGSHLMRLGFYVGMFAFFLSFPILSPSDVNPNISSDTHSTLGWALALTVIGFELTYRVFQRPSRKQLAPSLIEVGGRQRRWLLGCVFIGMAAWFFSVWDYAYALNAPVSSVLLMMRGVIEGSQPATTNYLALALSAGIFLAATAATLLLSSENSSARAAVFCWPVVAACTTVGFLGGSRAGFLYAFVPLAVALWKKLSKLPFTFAVRVLGALCAVATVIVIWSAMTAMRGADIRDFEGGIENISPITDAQGAFDIYSTTAEVVDTFPARIPYVHGESLIPLIFGMVPRALWPDKPYPFGLYMNIVNGESLQARSASLAVGLTGEGYGNFGLLGTFLWGALLGLGCRFGDRYLARFNHQSAIRLLLAGLAAVWVSMIVRGGVPEMFYMGLQVIILPTVMTKLLTARLPAIHIASSFGRPDGLSSAGAGWSNSLRRKRRAV